MILMIATGLVIASHAHGADAFNIGKVLFKGAGTFQACAKTCPENERKFADAMVQLQERSDKLPNNTAAGEMGKQPDQKDVAQFQSVLRTLAPDILGLCQHLLKNYVSKNEYEAEATSFCVDQHHNFIDVTPASLPEWRKLFANWKTELSKRAQSKKATADTHASIAMVLGEEPETLENDQEIIREFKACLEKDPKHQDCSQQYGNFIHSFAGPECEVPKDFMIAALKGSVDPIGKKPAEVAKMDGSITAKGVQKLKVTSSSIDIFLDREARAKLKKLSRGAKKLLIAANGKVLLDPEMTDEFDGGLFHLKLEEGDVNQLKPDLCPKPVIKPLPDSLKVKGAGGV